MRVEVALAVQRVFSVLQVKIYGFAVFVLITLFLEELAEILYF